MKKTGRTLFGIILQPAAKVWPAHAVYGMLLLLLGSLPACVMLAPASPAATSPPPSPIPTSTPIVEEVPPTATNPPVEVSVTTLPSPTPPPTFTPTPFPITLEPTITPTPQPTLPPADIQISAPGPLSKVVSPILLRALVTPGVGGRVRIELFGEDGRLLVRQVLIFNALPDRKVSLATEVDFEIAAVAETGRLSLSIDDRFGRLQYLASVELILLGSGQADINPPGDQLPAIIIEEPPPDTLIQGGEVIVSGLARPTGDQPLVLELITRDGKIVGSRLAAVAETPVEKHRPFAAAVPYQVEATTRVQLVVRERGVRIPGTAFLASQEIIVSP